ncbi:hypothetical protein [Halorussus salinisoli]|uniref:hypothetical protein n=1 Tax=Halorussus salinisoli TaxID=2558242 RepID=UPI0010C1BBD8|nr:hypothetical protein [Halorussus salinisoli]
MAKTSTSRLSSYVTEELITYLGEGALNSAQYAKTIDYSGLEIEDFDRLKKLHFVLYEDVVDYIEMLPERLRRIKTVTNHDDAVVRGEVRGAVDWRQTVQKRANVGYDDPTLFVVNNSEVEYDIPENRVVKKLLAAIAEPLTEDIEAIEQEWRDMWDDRDIVNLQQTLAHNIYLDALPSSDEISLSSRDLTTARRSRHRLYTEGYRLYRLYDDLMNSRFDRQEVRDLLTETLVTPTKDYKLFELFCVFGVIRQLQQQYSELELRPIKPEMEALAWLDSPNRRVEIYYDQNGPLSFFEAYPDSDELAKLGVPEMVQRQAEAFEAQERAVEDFLSRGSQHTFYSGRPDFLVLVYRKEDASGPTDEDEGELTDVLLGEVKYTRSKATFSRGLRELFEYLYFVRENDQYLFGEKAVDGEVVGILCTDGVNTDTDTSEGVTHITTDNIVNVL